MNIEHPSSLISEGRCQLTLSRSARGVITLMFRTHTLGGVEVTIPSESFAGLVFGVAEVDATISRVLPLRTPTYIAKA